MSAIQSKIHRSRVRCDALESRTLLTDTTFDIDLVFSGLLRTTYAAYQVLWTDAAARWEKILTADIPDVGEGDWGDAIDDLQITASASAIDGVGGVLGGADVRYRRSDSGLPITANFRVDSADLNNAGLADIIMHEMGHTLGIGSLWTNFGLVNDYGGSNPTYIGPAALAEYRAIKGDATLTSIPLENTGNLGTRDVHWRESIFARELMTGFYNAGFVNPLSRMSAASLMDLGYPGVNPDAADAYNLAGGNAIPTLTSFTPSSTSSAPTGTLTLTANGVADVTGGVANVRFYRESNGIPGLQASGNVLVKDELIFADTAGPDYSATVSLDGLPVGSYTYYAQVSDTHGAVSRTVTATHQIVTLPAVPSAPDLISWSDSGISDSDNITNTSQPTLTGTTTSPAGTTIRIFADAVPIGQTTVASDQSWMWTSPTVLADGVRTLTVKAENGAGMSDASAPLVLTIDTAAPAVTTSSFEFATLLGVKFSFNESVVGSIDSADLNFANTTNSTSHASTYIGLAGNIHTFKFATFPPPKGDYIATLLRTGVTDLAGNLLASDASVSFFYLPGDIDQSRSVNFDDLLTLAQHYGAAGTFAQGDLNYSGTVDFDDLLMLAQNYGQSLLTVRASSSGETKKRGGASAIVG